MRGVPDVDQERAAQPALEKPHALGADDAILGAVQDERRRFDPSKAFQQLGVAAVLGPVVREHAPVLRLDFLGLPLEARLLGMREERAAERLRIPAQRGIDRLKSGGALEHKVVDAARPLGREP